MKRLIYNKNNKGNIIDTKVIYIENLTLGLIGVSDIGKRISKVTKAYDINILWAEYKGKTLRDDDYTDFETVLRESDVIR